MANTSILSTGSIDIPPVLHWIIRLFLPSSPSGDLTPQEEENLVQQAIKEPKAFDDLYRRYVNRIYAYHLVRTGSREEAEDLTSQTFLAAIEGLRGYRRQGSFPVWLFSIARRKLADHYREKSPLPLDLSEAAVFGLEEAVDHRLRLQQVSAALQSIEPDRVEALSLRVFGQMNTSEISRLLSRSEGAVRNLVYRALQDLRTKLVVETEMEEK